MEVEVARTAFVRVRDPRAVELADRVAAGLRGGLPRGLLLAESLAWQGRYADAARQFVNEGRLDKVRVRALAETDEIAVLGGVLGEGSEAVYKRSRCLKAFVLCCCLGLHPCHVQATGAPPTIAARCWRCSARCGSLTKPRSGPTSTHAAGAAQEVCLRGAGGKGDARVGC
jgi:hypothetical protein